MDLAGDVVFRVLTEHISQAHTGFESPLEVLAALDNDAGLQADVPSLELFLVVSRITGVVINVICVGSGHVGELGPKTDNHLRPFCNEMVPGITDHCSLTFKSSPYDNLSTAPGNTSLA